MHMASPEACFQAGTADECIAEIHRWMSPSSPFCNFLLRQALENIIGTMDQKTQDKLAQLGPLNLFVIVSGGYLKLGLSEMTITTSGLTFSSISLHDIPASKPFRSRRPTGTYSERLKQLESYMGTVC